MKGVILEAPCELRVDEVADPKLGPDRVILAVEACTICGGDLKAYVGQGRSPAKWPRQLTGHEYAGVVVEVGADVREFKVGDRVANVCLTYCGTCFACRTGHENFCQRRPEAPPGSERGAGFGEYVAFSVPQNGFSGHFVVPDEIDLTEAALAEPGTCAIGAVQRARLQPGDIVAVIGLGGLGQMTAQVAAGMGARVIGIDIRQEKLELAKAWCEWVIDSSNEDLASRVNDITKGCGVDVALEVVGLGMALEQAFDMVRVGGRVVIVGVHGRTVPEFHPEWIFRKDVELVGAKGAMPILATDGTPVVFDYMRRGIIKAAPLISRFALDQAQDGFEAQRTGAVAKAAIRPRP